MLSIRNRTPYILKIYAIYLYYSARSLRLASKCLEPLIKRSHVAIWKWLQYMDISNNLVIDRRKEKRKIKCVMIDETMITIKDEVYWLWIAYEPYTKKYLLMNISKDKTVLVCYNFIKRLKKLYGSKYTIYTDGAHYYNQACRWLRIKHIVYDSNGKNIMERAIQYIKDRTECFDDYFPCKDDCNKKHVINWFRVFTTYLNVRIDLSKFIRVFNYDGG
jgi:putative transposase